MLGKKRRSYLDHFHKNAAGEYIYSGEHYAYTTEKKPRRRALGELWVLCALAVATTLVGGCIPVPGLSGCAYVLIPYVVGVIASCSLIWTMGQLSAGGDPLREYVYLTTVKKLPHRTLITAAASCLAVLGEAVYLLRIGGGEKTGLAVLFLVLEVVAAVSAALAWGCCKGLSWDKTKKRED